MYVHILTIYKNNGLSFINDSFKGSSKRNPNLITLWLMHLAASIVCVPAALNSLIPPIYIAVEAFVSITFLKQHRKLLECVGRPID